MLYEIFQHSSFCPTFINYFHGSECEALYYTQSTTHSLLQRHAKKLYFRSKKFRHNNYMCTCTCMTSFFAIRSYQYNDCFISCVLSKVHILTSYTEDLEFIKLSFHTLVAPC